MAAMTFPEPVTEAAAVLTIRDVSQLTGVSIETLKYLQLTAAGPAYTENCGCVRYRMADVQKWQAMRRAAHVKLMNSYGGRA